MGNVSLLRNSLLCQLQAYLTSLQLSSLGDNLSELWPRPPVKSCVLCLTPHPTPDSYIQLSVLH